MQDEWFRATKLIFQEKKKTLDFHLSMKFAKNYSQET